MEIKQGKNVNESQTQKLIFRRIFVFKSKARKGRLKSFSLSRAIEITPQVPKTTRKFSGPVGLFLQSWISILMESLIFVFMTAVLIADVGKQKSNFLNI